METEVEIKKEKKLPVLPPCKICGKPASGFHYGINSCGACKGFFLRSIARTKPYTCLSNDQLCNIGPETSRRKSCQKCRFDKCLRLGMSKEAIKIGRYTYAKRTQDTLELMLLKDTDKFTLYKQDSQSGELDKRNYSPGKEAPGEDYCDLDVVGNEVRYERDVSPLSDEDERTQDSSKGVSEFLHYHQNVGEGSPSGTSIPSGQIHKCSSFESDDDGPRAQSLFSETSHTFAQSSPERWHYPMVAETDARWRFDVPTSHSHKTQTNNRIGDDMPPPLIVGLTSNDGPGAFEEHLMTRSDFNLEQKNPRECHDRFVSHLPYSDSEMLEQSDNRSAFRFVGHYYHNTSTPEAACRPYCPENLMLSRGSNLVSVNQFPYTHSGACQDLQRSPPNLFNARSDLTFHHHSIHSLSGVTNKRLHRSNISGEQFQVNMSPQGIDVSKSLDLGPPSKVPFNDNAGYSETMTGLPNLNYQTPRTVTTSPQSDFAAKFAATEAWEGNRADSKWADSSQAMETEHKMRPGRAEGTSPENGTTQDSVEKNANEPTTSRDNFDLDIANPHSASECSTQALDLSTKSPSYSYEAATTLLSNLPYASPLSASQLSPSIKPLSSELSPINALANYHTSTPNNSPQSFTEVLISSADLSPSSKSDHVTSSTSQKESGNSHTSPSRPTNKSEDVQPSLTSPSPVDDEDRKSSTSQLSVAEDDQPRPWSSEFSEDELDHVIKLLVSYHSENFVDNNNFDENQLRERTDLVYTQYRLQKSTFGELGALDRELYFEIYKSTGLDVDGRETLMSNFLHGIHKEISTVIKFFRQIPGFRHLPVKDQAILVKGSAHEFHILGLYRGWDNEEKFMTFVPLGAVLSEQDMRKIFPKEAMEYHIKMANALQSLNLTLEQVVLLKAIVATAPERDDMQASEDVWNIYWKLVNCLLMLLWRQGRQPLRKFSQIMSVLTEMRTYSVELRNSYMNMRSDIEELTGSVNIPFIYELFF